MDRQASWDVANGAAPRRALPPRFLVCGVIVLLAVGYLVQSGLSTATAYYLTVDELMAQSPAPTGVVRVSGEVVPGSIVREGATVRFSIADASAPLPVVYRGVVPDIFGEGIQVVVEGRHDAGSGFQAQTLLAKCPSKFEGASDPGAGT